MQCVPGMRCEVILSEEGLAGSRYCARVIELGKGGKVLVEFEVCALKDRAAASRCLRQSRLPYDMHALMM